MNARSRNRTGRRFATIIAIFVFVVINGYAHGQTTRFRYDDPPSVIKPCPRGTVRTANGSCRTKPDYERHCPSGYRKTNGKCVRIVRPCRPGYQLVGGKCRRPNFNRPRRCPKDRVAIAGRCVKITRPCRNGYHKIHGRCIRTIPPRRCPAGYQKKGNQCIKPPKKCPGGYRSVRGHCILVTRPCRQGYQKIRGKCIRIQSPPNRAPPRLKPENVLKPFVPQTSDIVDNIRPQEVLATFPLNVSKALVSAVARAHQLTVIEETPLPMISQHIVTFKVAPGRSVGRLRTALQADPRVLFAQPNYLYNLSADTSLQYALDKLEAPRAHDIARGNGVLVAVIDSGIDGEHSALRGSIIQRFNAAGGDPHDTTHGTAVASIIAAHQSLIGVAPGALILSVRAFGSKSPDKSPASSSIILLRGTAWAIRNGAQILNLSFTGPPDPLMQSLLGKAIDAGTVVVAAAGNQGDGAPPAYPAAYSRVIAATATDANNHLFAQANRGDYVDIAAPGVDILTAAPGNSYGFTSGTSMAAAHVSAAIALILEKHPGTDTASILSRFSATAIDLGAPGKDHEFGFGLLNSYGALTGKTE